MPRQTFATREFFVSIPETTTHQTVLNLPNFFTRIRFAGENPKLHCLTFLYVPQDEQEAVHIIISVLPLDEGCTKITVHGSYGNGCVFTKDRYMDYVMSNVEAALQAAASGSTSLFEPIVPKKKFLLRYTKVKLTRAALFGNTLKGYSIFKPSHS
jgi:hypothetical protein